VVEAGRWVVSGRGPATEGRERGREREPSRAARVAREVGSPYTSARQEDLEAEQIEGDGGRGRPTQSVRNPVSPRSTFATISSDPRVPYKEPPMGRDSSEP
jgi:hypothetical protein